MQQQQQQQQQTSTQTHIRRWRQHHAPQASCMPRLLKPILQDLTAWFKQKYLPGATETVSQAGD
jgi:hypothetical protein